MTDKQQTFLGAVAENLYARYGGEISQLTMVFPSRRSQLFFFDELSRIIRQPLWSPEYMSMDEVISSFTTLKKADDFALLIYLYEVYRKHTKTDETFDSFYFWGETLINDFNDIDKYLVDARLLFSNLKAQKNLEGDFSFLSKEQIGYIRQFWSSFDPAGESHLQERFIEIWDVMYLIYNDFRQILKQRGQTYSGMIYRDAAENINSGTAIIDKKYVFAGFNAVGECEAALFTCLRNAGKADFYWDCDPYYIDDKAQEAGLFMRRNIERYPPPPDFHLAPSLTEQKDIHIISAPSDVAMAKSLPVILQQMKASFDKQTAIALADENLLIPVLYSLPPECADVNITLGYPLVQIPVFVLAELLVRMQNSYRDENRGFYCRDVLAVLKHGYVFRSNRQQIEATIADIVQNNRIYIDVSLFAGNEFLQKIFTPATGYRQTVDYLTEIFETVANLPDMGEDERLLRREYIFFINKSLIQLKNAIAETGVETGRQVFFNLVRNIFRSMKIPFSGMPLEGLQVMSMHETRALDFDNIVLLSANEGRLPAATGRLSYIPYNLRKAYGLPCFEHFEANAAYNFYRLIQRAKNIRLLYSTVAEQTGTGEMSRYLYQLKFESGFAVSEYPVTFNINSVETRSITIPKDEETMKALMHYTSQNPQKTLSPSAINSYISCPVKFYLEKIARLKQDETVNEDLPQNIIGNIIHKVMETLYNPLKNRRASIEKLGGIKNGRAQIDALIDRFFALEFYKKQELPAEFHNNGKMLLVRDVTRKYIDGILNCDCRRAGFVPLDFESRVSASIVAGSFNIRLEGIIDRIDQCDNEILIIDYKTGGGGRTSDRRMKFNGVASLFDSDPDRRNKEVFQTFLYAYMYTKSLKPDSTIVPAIYFVRDCYSPSFTHIITDAESKQKVADFDNYIAEFEDALATCLRDIFDPSKPFTQTEHKKNCQICQFYDICVI
ncbi:MAG: PD-(D/E)XK nuclease family protein [Prevotellaceae bacterium]|jgi:CRISPR/Cas system-associated exonuclease Cas4 (RecB family)|nr:PD-(D/E)XK nuclease family protein [Prevotellaceae bacterium]